MLPQENMKLSFQVRTRIQKPLSEVFDAVYNPLTLSAYFATGSASAPLVEGSTVIWQFADFPGEHPVTVKKMIPNQLISFEWASGVGMENTLTEIAFVAKGGETLVTISESGWPETEKGLRMSYSNCHGWTQMSCSLKAYLEYGIQLRKGFYNKEDFKGEHVD